jgi:hypothetical protein
MDIGFTGSRYGLTDAQGAALAAVFMVINRAANWLPDQQLTLHHGACVGADAQAARLARLFGWQTVAYPSTLHEYRADTSADTVVHPPAPPLVRNREIAAHSSLVVACPRRSSTGTWHAIRTAANLDRDVIVIDEGGRVYAYDRDVSVVSEGA